MEDPVQEYIRLNLGCGSKVLNGWVNVDTVSRGGRNFQSIKGKDPDVNADIRNLPFDDNYADEAMAIHVLEHFYVWEAADVLKEWVRVLKPGGKLIIEVPDLHKVIYYIENGETNPSFTLWPLYGAPSEQDPRMVHNWCYTMNSLGKMMVHIGLKNVEREVAQFHFKEARDMRMVGYKDGA